MPETTDEELYTRYKTGDDDSFTKLYIRHKAAVRGWLSKSLADSYYCDIHDLVQGVFLDLSQRTPVFTNGSLENWLIQIAVRDATDHLRLKTAKKRYTGWPESEIRDTDRITKVTPLDSLCTKESREVLASMIERLPEIEQSVIRLFLDGTAKSKIARTLGISPRNFLTRFNYAVRLLKIMAHGHDLVVA